MHFHQFQINNTQIFITPLSKDEGVIFSQLSQKGIRKYAFAGKKIIIIGNKVSYATGVFCSACGHIPYCRYCDIPIAYHTNENGIFFGLCHLCKTVYQHPTECEQCGSIEINDFGVGLQQINERLTHQGISSIQLSSSTGNSPSKVAKIYDILQSVNTLIGTTLLCTRPVNRNTDLLVFQSIDSFLIRPDYNATIDLINLLNHTINSHKPKVLIVQTKDISNPILSQWASGNTHQIIDHENTQLLEHGYPPYGEIAIIMYKHEIESKVYDKVHTLYRELCFLHEKSNLTLIIKSVPAVVYKKYGKFHYQIVIKGDKVRNFLDSHFEQLKILQRGFKVDRNPKGL